MPGNNTLTYEKVEDLLQEYKKTDLREISHARFRMRYERKFLLPSSALWDLLQRAKRAYAVLEVNGICLQPYSSHYFDTPQSHMYLNHHNSAFPRYKVRYRTYHSNNRMFLEVKKKDNQDRTFKKRLGVEEEQNLITKRREKEFVTAHTPYHPENLISFLRNAFYRITLADPDSGERITLDTGISFSNEEDLHKNLEGIVVIETKTGSRNEKSDFEKLMLKNRGTGVASSFSKYCIGRILFDDQLKYNNFKPVLRKIISIQNR